MKKVLIIRGPLGVGKSTISKKLAKENDFNYISLDKVIDDNNLAGNDGIPLENFLKANEIISKMIDDSDKTMIIDGCFYYQEQLDDLAAKYRIAVFSLISSVEKCIERDSKRAKVYGEDSARFVHMVTTKIRSGYEIDNANLTIDETVEKIVEKLNSN